MVVLSSDYHGQAKAVWILFLLVCFGFGYVLYFASDKHILFASSRKKYKNIFNKTQNLLPQCDLSHIKENEVLNNVNYLYNNGRFIASTTSRCEYFSSGNLYFDSLIEDLRKAKEFIFIEYFIISDGILLTKLLSILQDKSSEGVEVRIIYDDMGSHGTLKRKTKKQIKKAGIQLLPFNKLLPVFNIALNLRDHRKIVVIDGKVGYTGGTNLADEYTNDRRMYGYWKDEGIKIVGNVVDNFTIAFLSQWEFLTGKHIDYSRYINKSDCPMFPTSNSVIIPFMSGPNLDYSIAQNMYSNIISNAEEKLYIMTPYFIPDETIINLLTIKAKSGVDVRIILPDVPDKRFVYMVSRNNAEKLISSGVKIYTMTNSFVHSKVLITENSAIVGSINVDLRSFNQQFESAVYLNEPLTLAKINQDFEKTFAHSVIITDKNMKRKNLSFRVISGLLNILSTFM